MIIEIIRIIIIIYSLLYISYIHISYITLYEPFSFLEIFRAIIIIIYIIVIYLNIIYINLYESFYLSGIFWTNPADLWKRNKPPGYIRQVVPFLVIFWHNSNNSGLYGFNYSQNLSYLHSLYFQVSGNPLNYKAFRTPTKIQ